MALTVRLLPNQRHIPAVYIIVKSAAQNNNNNHPSFDLSTVESSTGSSVSIQASASQFSNGSIGCVLIWLNIDFNAVANLHTSVNPYAD